MLTSSEPSSVSTPASGDSWKDRLFSHLPPNQVVRYLVVGAWNTLFGYGTYALLTYLLTDIVPYDYMAAGLLSSVVNITASYLGYKVFVFKTKGNFWREYFRCYVVYGTTILINLALLPLVVYAINHFIAPGEYAKYLAGAILTVGSVIVSFLGHKNFTFTEGQSSQIETVATENAGRQDSK